MQLPSLQIDKVPAHTAVEGACNTIKHTVDEAPWLAAEASETYDNTAVDYGIWFDLLRDSQNDRAGAYIVDLPYVLMLDALSIAHAFNAQGPNAKNPRFLDFLDDIPTAKPQEIDADVSSTPNHPGFFVRCDECSPKGFQSGLEYEAPAPVRSFKEGLLLLVGSNRVRSAMQHRVDAGDKSNFHLYFIRWNTHFDPAWEFRVFVPPFREANASDMRITTISQYRWHRPFAADITDEEAVDVILHKVHEDSQKILEQIREYKGGEPAARLKGGFVFDVLYRETGPGVLVELNPFGATRNAGSCLHHWLKDCNIIYGVGGESGGQKRPSVHIRVSR